MICLCIDMKILSYSFYMWNIVYIFNFLVLAYLETGMTKYIDPDSIDVTIAFWVVKLEMLYKIHITLNQIHKIEWPVCVPLRGWIQTMQTIGNIFVILFSKKGKKKKTRNFVLVVLRVGSILFSQFSVVISVAIWYTFFLHIYSIQFFIIKLFLYMQYFTPC